MSPRTAILSYALGTGHTRVAQVLAGQLAGLGHACDHRPLEEWITWDYDLLFRRGYLLLALRFPAGWEAMYRSPRFARRDGLGLALMRPRAWKRFGKLGLGDYDLVAATQYNALEVASDWKTNTGRSLPLACVITDYDIYPLWARRAADLFLVAHEDLAAPLERLGVSRGRIRAPGIPVAPAFHEPQDPLRTRAGLGLREDRPVALVFGGGVGAGPMESCIRSALDARGWQVVAVCGRNEGLRRRLVPLAQEEPARLRVLGYRGDVAALMSASDVVITKGGGLSLTEALYTGARVVAMPSLPGQERANIDFMTARGWLEACDDPRDLRGLLEGHGERERRACPLPPEPARTAAALLHQLAGRS